MQSGVLADVTGQAAFLWDSSLEILSDVSIRCSDLKIDYVREVSLDASDVPRSPDSTRVWRAKQVLESCKDGIPSPLAFRAFIHGID